MKYLSPCSVLCSITIGVFLVSCAPFAPTERKALGTLPATMPQTYPSKSKAKIEPTPVTQAQSPWWNHFQSTDLNNLIEKSLQANFDILTAWANVRQSEAVARKAGASRLPTLNFDGSAGTNRFSTQQFSAQTPVQGLAESYNLGLAASYELDLWGRATSQQEAEVLRTKASRFDLQSSRMSVAAEVADAWASLLGSNQELEVLKKQIKINKDLVELQTVRFNNGLGTSLEVLQQEELLASVKAEVPVLQQNAAILRNQLAILQGTLPGTGLSMDESASLPVLEPMPDPGLPIQLLDARPDVGAAWARLAAADWDVSAAHANRYPSLRLTASGVFQAAQSSLLFTNWVGALVGALTYPVFDGGALKAEEARVKAQSDINVQSYAKTVALAIQEVDNALVTERGQVTTLRRLQQQYKFAQAAMEEARNSYLGGVSSFLNYITELKNVQSLERTIARQKTAVVRARIALYRALGSLTFPDSIPQDQPTTTPHTTR